MKIKHIALVALALLLMLTACVTPMANSPTNGHELPFSHKLQDALDKGLEQYKQI